MKKIVILKRIVIVLMLVCVLALVSCNFKGCSTKCDHEWDDGTLIDVTECGVGATARFTCLKCGETQTKNAETHNYVAIKTVDSTCTMVGYTEYGCSRCNASCVSDFVNSSGHKYGEEIVVKEETCTTGGSYVIICEDCGYTFTYSHSHKGHIYQATIENDNEITYECTNCLDTITIHKEENIEQYIGNEELFNVEPTFSFDIVSSDNEESIREKLKIIEYYFNDTEYENEEDVIKEYNLAYKGDNIWRVSIVSNYEYDTTYIAKLTGGVCFVDYKCNELIFTITEDPNHENDYEYQEGIVFLQALENANPGYYPYYVMSDEGEYLYLSLNKIEGLEKGQLICVGDITSTDQITDESEYYFGKIYDFYSLPAGNWIVLLEEPDISDIFEELDISFNEELDFENVDIDFGQAETEIIAQLYTSEEFVRFLSAINVSANKYFEENGYYAEELANVKSFLDKIKFDPDITVEGKTLKVVLKGTLDIPIKDKNKNNLGNFLVSFTIDMENQFGLDVSYKIKKKWFIPVGLKYFDVAVIQNTKFDFNFKVSIDIDYSLDEDKYVQNIESNEIHRPSCAHLTRMTDLSKLKGLSATSAEKMIKNNPDWECKHCQPTKSFNYDILVINTSPDNMVIHAYNCFHVGQMSESNKLLSDENATYWIKQGYTCCDWCHPDNREEKNFEAIYSETLYCSDWQQVATDIVQLAKDAGVDEYATKGVTLVHLEYPIYGPVMAALDLNFVFSFKLEASFNYDYAFEQQNTYGVRLSSGRVNSYNSKEFKVIENALTLMGKAEVRAGLQLDVNVNIKGLSKWIRLGVTAEAGMYARLNGILYYSFIDTDNGENYAAAYFEVGIYVDVQAYFKLFAWDGDVTIYSDEFPLIVMGYSKAYFGYETYLDKIEIDGYYDIDAQNLLSVKYFDLKTMESKTGELLLSETEKYRVSIAFADGRYCKIEEGRIVATNDAPCYFTDKMTITVDSDDSWKDFKKDSSVYYLGVYEIEIEFNSNNGHIESDWIIDVEATTESEGSKHIECTVCGDTIRTETISKLALSASEGLEYALNEDGQSYSVVGIGTCTDTELVIPSTYQGLPVTAIGDMAFIGMDMSTFQPKESFIVSVVIPDSVTSIGPGAFLCCSNLKSVTMTDSVTEIGESAFAMSQALETVVLSNSISAIKEGTFTWCQGLKNVNIPTSLISVCADAFYDCKLIVEMILPNTLTSIGESAFAGCSALKSINVPNGVESIGDQAFSRCTSLVSITIPDSVTSIGCAVFYHCDALESVSLPSGITKIDSYEYISTDGTTVSGYEGMFGYCKSLKNIVIPDSVTIIEPHSFYGCESLASITLGNSITSIGDKAFYECVSLESVTIPDSVKIIGEQLFNRCASLKTVALSSSIEHITYGIFYKCSALETVTIGKNIKTIDRSAFEYCSVLSTINFEGTVAEWKLIEISSTWAEYTGDYTIYCTDGEIAKDGTVTYYNTVSEGLEYTLNADGQSYSVVGIGTCTDTNLVIPSEYNGLPVTDIGCSWNGLGGSNIVSVVIPDSVTYIDDFAFSGCLYLEKVVMSKNVTCIGSMAFTGCVSLKTITIPQGSTVGSRTFEGCESLEYIYVEEGNPWLESIDGNLYSADGKIMYQYAYGKTDTTFELPAGVTEIRHFAFSGAKALKHIVLNSELIQIGSGVFRDCDSLESITIPSSIMRIGDESEPIDALSNADWVFGRCENLTTINYSGTVEMWGQIQLEMVWDDSNHTIYCTDGEIAKDGTVTYYEEEVESSQGLEYALNEDGKSYSVAGIGTCTDTDIIIPSTYQGLPVTSLGYGAFAVCSSLTSITIPDSVTSIGYGAFTNCSSLTSITIGNSVTSIGDYAFYGCSSLTSVIIPDSVTSIGDYAFRDCTSLTSITIPDSVSTIGGWAFCYCTSLTSIDIPCSVKSIGISAFEHCTSLTSIVVPDSVTSIGDQVFSACYSLSSVVIPNSVTSIGKNAFYYCLSLASINIPDSVTSIGDQAFWDCDSLTRIVIPNSVATIGEWTFACCNLLTSVVIPDSVTSIGDNAFDSCGLLASIEIPNSVTTIGDYAFRGCDSLTSLVIPNSVTSIGDHTFYSCDSLTIYCEAESQPSGWHSNWNYSDRPVIWSYKPE